MTEPTASNRPLTAEERELVRWMLEHSDSVAKSFLPQLERASVTPWRCPCGCASINFSIEGHPEPSGGVRPLADFVFGDEADLKGITVYQRNGTLSCLEVYGYGGDPPKDLPSPEALRPFADPGP